MPKRACSAPSTFPARHSTARPARPFKEQSLFLKSGDGPPLATQLREEDPDLDAEYQLYAMPKPGSKSGGRLNALLAGEGTRILLCAVGASSLSLCPGFWRYLSFC